jgi:hypothetical protein
VTYPLYEDRESRRAVEGVLKALVDCQHGDAILPAIVKFLKQECLKKGIAHANAFVLVDWCSVLLLEFAKSSERWSKYGLDVALANARVLETCVGAGNTRRAGRISDSALVSTRRALRAVLRSEATGQDALSKLVTTFTAKGSAPAAGNAVFLGVIAGVSSRLPSVRSEFEKLKPEYYAFYVREMPSLTSSQAFPPWKSCARKSYHHSRKPYYERQKWYSMISSRQWSWLYPSLWTFPRCCLAI